MLTSPKTALPAGTIFEMRSATGNLRWLRAQIAVGRRMVREWRRRHRSRQELRALSREEIRDFCLDPIEAEREAAKPFWRA
jgi:uncharacterized protein YjiS (DUF1127 family)